MGRRRECRQRQCDAEAMSTGRRCKLCIRTDASENTLVYCYVHNRKASNPATSAPKRFRADSDKPVTKQTAFQQRAEAFRQQRPRTPAHIRQTSADGTRRAFRQRARGHRSRESRPRRTRAARAKPENLLSKWIAEDESIRELVAISKREGEELKWDNTFYAQYSSLRCVQTPHWKYVHAFGDTVKNELYDFLFKKHNFIS